MKLFLVVVFVLIFMLDSYNASVPVNAVNTEQELRQNKLHTVQRIYIGDMGKTDEALRFRLLLEEELIEKGFTIVESLGNADAVLTGALSVRVLDETSEARVYVKLDTLDGKRIWSKDFGNGIFKHLLSFKEPVRLRARDVARSLRDDWKKSAKQ